MKEATIQKILEEFRKLDLDNQEKFVNALEKALHSPRNRTEPNHIAGELSHSHYTTENSKCKGDAIFIDPNAPFEDGKVAAANIDGAIICGKAFKTADGYELKNEVGDTFYTDSICGIATWRRISLKGGEEE